MGSLRDFEDAKAEEASDESAVGGEVAAVPMNTGSEGGEGSLLDKFSTLCHSSLSNKGYLLHRMYDIVDVASFFRELSAVTDGHHASD